MASSSSHAAANGRPGDDMDLSRFVEPRLLAKYDAEMIQFFRRVFSSKTPPLTPKDVSIEYIREHADQFRQPNWLDTAGRERVADDEVTSEDGAAIPVRIYYPDPAKHGRGPYAVHLNYHGGGFVLGDLGSEASLCLGMSDGAGVVVIDVNYRHCPEATWGKCFQDGWAALVWARDTAGTLNIRADSISIGGISAGGHICAVLQHRARDAGIALRLCMMSVTPVTASLSYTRPQESPYPSFCEFANEPILPFTQTLQFGALSQPPDRMAELKAMWPGWWFAPIDAPSFRGICDTFIRTAEMDGFRDECEAYGMKLVAAGSNVAFKRYVGVPHLFMYMPFLSQKAQFDKDAVKALKNAHA